MIKYFTDLLSQNYDIAGIGMFNYISFRAAIAIIASLLIGTVYGRRIIDSLRYKQVGEDIRDLGLQGQLEKKGTPTMGGIIILIATLIPVLLICDLSNVYIQLMIITTIWLGAIGFADDYIKVYRKNKEGLNGRLKIVGQIGLGAIIGITMWQSNQITVREVAVGERVVQESVVSTGYGYEESISVKTTNSKAATTTIPFIREREFDYHDIFSFENSDGTFGWVLYVIIAIFIITAVSNGANLTDGLDGLAAGTSAIVVVVLAILAYFSGNLIYADYLNIMYIPGSGELFVYCAAFIGALIGFLWYNSYPAQVFMGDTGSLAIGGIIAALALLIRKELLLPLLCGVFLVEVVSVMAQVTYFKYTKRKYGEGRRILLMSPLHHHYQKKGFFEVKIVTRFWIIQLLLAAVTLVTLKIR